MTHEQILEQSRKDLKAIYKQAKKNLAKLEVNSSKELEIGKWYRCTEKSALFFVQEINDAHVYAYGFDYLGGWNDLIYWMNLYDYHDLNRFTEATPQEVEKSLIEEAKRRGFTPFYDTFHFEHKLNILYDRFGLGQEVIFSNGQWATIIEQDKPTEVADKFAELKEAHRNGKVIQCRAFPFNNELGWLDDNKPSWSVHFEYRIKPEEKPKVGDVCKFWSDDEPGFIVSHYLREDNGLHTFDGSIYFDHARVITSQQVQELLFGKEPSCPQ